MACASNCINEVFDCNDCVKLDEIVARLAAYEDTNLTPEEIMILCSMDRRAKMAELLRMEENKPLTLEELRGMDGEPVWVRDLRSGDYMCRVIASTDKYFMFFTDGTKENRSYGTYWLAYRRRPEEGTI